MVTSAVTPTTGRPPGGGRRGRHEGRPATKFAVPSIGSTTHRSSAPSCGDPSSPCTGSGDPAKRADDAVLRRQVDRGDQVVRALEPQDRPVVGEADDGEPRIHGAEREVEVVLEIDWSRARREVMPRILPRASDAQVNAIGPSRRFGPTAAVGYPLSAGRIRLVAYGARLESVLGESPRGFESPILRAPKGP